MISAPWMALIAAAFLSLSGIACKKKDGGGNGGGGPDGGDGGVDMQDGEDGGGDGPSEFDFGASGALAIGVSPLEPGFDMESFEPLPADIPDVKKNVYAASPGSLALDDGLALMAFPSCMDPGAFVPASAFYCRLVKPGAGPTSYIDALLQSSERAAGINERTSGAGALCLRMNRSSFEMTAGDVSFEQEFSCWDQFNDTDEGTAFGKSASTLWMRESDGLAATVTLDGNGDAAVTDLWVKRYNGSDPTKGVLMHIVATGTEKVEIAAVGPGLNSKQSCGVQVVLDRESELMRMRYIWDTAVNTCADDNVSVACYSAAEATFGNDMGAACDDLAFETPMLVQDIATSATLPTGALVVSATEIDGFGNDTVDDLKELMSIRVPDPIFTTKERMFASGSQSLPGIIENINGKTQEIASRYTNEPPACLVDAPVPFDVVEPLNLELPMFVSCISGDAGEWDGFGQFNGSAYYVTSQQSNGSADMLHFRPDSSIEAWFIRGFPDDDQSRSLTHVVKSGDEFELTGISSNYGYAGNLACGFHLRKSGSLMYVTSAFTGTDCANNVWREYCVETVGFTDVELAECAGAGLDIATITTLRNDIPTSKYKDLVQPKPSGGGDTGPLDQTKVPPIAQIDPPTDGQGSVQVVPLRSNNKTIPKISGGGVNFGRNCKHSGPIGKSTMDGVYEYDLSDLGELLAALRTSAASGNAFLSFNFETDATYVGSGASLTYSFDVKAEFFDQSGALLVDTELNDIGSSAYVILSLFNDVDLENAAKIRVTTAGTVSVACAGNSGQAHLAAGLSDLKLRF